VENACKIKWTRHFESQRKSIAKAGGEGGGVAGGGGGGGGHEQDKMTSKTSGTEATIQREFY
jgi:hypothetical protein